MSRESPVADLLPQLRRRACLYAGWDRLLSRRTRFFGAAAVTNAALWEFFSTAVGRVWLKPPAVQFLSMAGRFLERLNLEAAACIHARAAPRIDLDESMVVTEQAAVESMLRRLRSRDSPSHTATLFEMNRLLALAGSSSGGSVFSLTPSLSSVSTYHLVLARVEQQLCRPARFGLRSDRERIGHTLIRLLRAEPVMLPRCEERTCWHRL